MCARVGLSLSVCLVLFIGRALGECILPEHPTNGRHVAHERDCEGKGKLPACEGVPGTSAPEDWLLVVRCDPGYQLEISNDSDVPSNCTNGVWSNPQLPNCIKQDLLNTENQRCIVPNPPPNSQYRMFLEECGADTLAPGSQVPQDCILFLNCAPGYQRKLGEGDFLTHCNEQMWSPPIPDDHCINSIELKQEGAHNSKASQPLLTQMLSAASLPSPKVIP